MHFPINMPRNFFLPISRGIPILLETETQESKLVKDGKSHSYKLSIDKHMNCNIKDPL